MEFEEIPEFQRDIKQLLKKFRTLRDDLEVLKKVLSSQGFNHPQPPFSFRIADLGFDSPSVIKIKKFSSKSLKGKGSKTGLRLIYAFYPERNLIKFIEIYFKADQENHDSDRILKQIGLTA